MLLSVALLLLTAMSLGAFLQRLKLPGLIGMILTGILLGPFVLELIDPAILGMSADLRRLALLVILLRAGLSIDLNDLKKVGRPAILMCFLPASFEILGVWLLAPRLLGLSSIDALILGAVLGAVSPAVVVPRMIRLMDEGYGTKKSIPQLVLAGASVDDIYVIVLFTSFLSLAQGGSFDLKALAGVPVSVLLGILLGVIGGYVLVWFFRSFHMRDTAKVMILLSISFLYVSLEDALKGYIMLSGLLAVMATGAFILKEYPVLAQRLRLKFGKVWVAAEIFLFVLVGAAVDITTLSSSAFQYALLIVLALLFRIVGVFVALLGTSMTTHEKVFISIAYLPKATVQAAIGGIPLAMGLASGQVILAVAVLAILITAPFGASLIDLTYKKLLSR